MKRFVAFIVLSFFFSSCTTFIFTGRDNTWYAVKKIDGKKQWGAVSERYVRGLPCNELDADGNEIRKVKGYIHLSSTERELKRELGYWPFDAIGIKYDSIRLVNFHDYEMFFAYKDGKRYYYTGGFRPIADEQPVERVEYISSGASKCFKNLIEANFYLADAKRKYPNIRFCGIMGMATFTDDESIIRSDFAAIRNVYQSALSQCQTDSFSELSIGMSDDYPIAIEYGSTMVRIGSMIFGIRQY